MPSALARLLSYILHPLLVPFYAFFVVMNLNTYMAYSISPHVQQVVLILVFITTVALPVLTSVMLLQQGAIRSMEMETIAERRIPFIATAGYYFMCFFLLQQIPVPRVLGLMVIGAAISIFLSWLISFRWKISIHMVGIGGMAGLLIALSILLSAGLATPVIVCIAMAGMLGTARLTLGAHTPMQIYCGFFLGLLSEWMVISYGIGV